MIVSARFLAIATILLSGIGFFPNISTLSGQDEQYDAHSQTVSGEHADSHSAEAEGHGEAGDEEFNSSEYIMEHVKDSHEWYILTKKDGHHISVPLPVIVYSKHSGLQAFSSKRIAHGHSHNGFQMGRAG